MEYRGVFLCRVKWFAGMDWFGILLAAPRLNWTAGGDGSGRNVHGGAENRLGNGLC